MIAIIPEPVSVVPGAGVFRGSPATEVVCPDSSPAMGAAQQLAALLTCGLRGSPAPGASCIRFVVADLPQPEGYELSVSADGVTIRAAETRGFLHAVQTLRQLNPESVRDGHWTWPALRINDYPRFPWRGMHLDVSRHFFPVPFVKRYLDLLALHKLNTFHWHLTDDQGWRLEIRRYPELTRQGAWRVDRSGVPWNDRLPRQPGEAATYGGCYSQAEVRDVVTYATALGIDVVPEIEMPAHSLAALACYPDLSCRGGPFAVATGQYWPEQDLYCAGNEATFAFLQGVLSEVLELFPGRFIHIGGDEAEPLSWQECPRCQARMRELKISSAAELQGWFMSRIAHFLEQHGRQAIGWEEMLGDRLPPAAAIMSWRGMDAGAAAARAGRDVVMCPVTHCYFDHYQHNPATGPPAFGGYTPLEKVYTFEPVPAELDADAARHILGAQGNLWTEYIPAAAHAEYMALPRMAALSEVVWSPPGRRHWPDFQRRLPALLEHYRRLGVTCAQAAGSAP